MVNQIDRMLSRPESYRDARYRTAPGRSAAAVVYAMLMLQTRPAAAEDLSLRDSVSNQATRRTLQLQRWQQQFEAAVFSEPSLLPTPTQRMLSTEGLPRETGGAFPPIRLRAEGPSVSGRNNGSAMAGDHSLVLPDIPVVWSDKVLALLIILSIQSPRTIDNDLLATTTKPIPVSYRFAIACKRPTSRSSLRCHGGKWL